MQLHSRGLHRITQHTDSADTNLYYIARNQETNTRRRPRGDYISGIQGHHARNPPDQKRARVNHERSIPGLTDPAIHPRLHLHVGWIDVRLDVRSNRAKRVEPFTAGELHVSLLKIAGGDVVKA